MRAVLVAVAGEDAKQHADPRARPVVVPAPTRDGRLPDPRTVPAQGQETFRFVHPRNLRPARDRVLRTVRHGHATVPFVLNPSFRFGTTGLLRPGEGRNFRDFAGGFGLGGLRSVRGGRAAVAVRRVALEDGARIQGQSRLLPAAVQGGRPVARFFGAAVLLRFRFRRSGSPFRTAQGRNSRAGRFVSTLSLVVSLAADVLVRGQAEEGDVHVEEAQVEQQPGGNGRQEGQGSDHDEEQDVPVRDGGLRRGDFWGGVVDVGHGR